MHHCYEPIMQRLLTLQIEYKILLRAADLFKDLERPDLVIGDEEYAKLMGRIDEACNNMRVVSEELGAVAWEKVQMKKVGSQLAKVVMGEVEKRRAGEELLGMAGKEAGQEADGVGWNEDRDEDGNEDGDEDGDEDAEGGVVVDGVAIGA